MSEGGQRQTGDVVVVADDAARSGLINLLGQGRRGQGSRFHIVHFFTAAVLREVLRIS